MITLLRGLWRRFRTYSDYDDALGDFKDYWRIYGGINQLKRSIWLWSALAITIICTPLWLNDEWTSIPLGVVPNLLGFSIGALAIILSFPNSKLFKFFAEDGRENSAYMEFSARFIHFICVQVSAIISALLAKALNIPYFPWIDILAFWLFVYSLLAAVAIGFSVFRLSQAYNKYNDL